MWALSALALTGEQWQLKQQESSTHGHVTTCDNLNMETVQLN